jgi:glycosyltransferase involved in cell wall biosynthesis
MSLVSIITPSYNQAEFLEKTIQSVLSQDYKPVEYLVVDGGSSDGSLEIIHQYADRLAWWVSEADAGQAEAINKGLRQAHGEIIAWLNSDDLYLPAAISQAVAAFQENPQAGLVFGDAITIDAHGRQLNRLSFGGWGLDELMAFRIICQPAAFMRRRVLDQAGGLDTSYHYMLDHHLWLRMARIAPIHHVQQVWAAARYHPGAKNVAQAAGFGQDALRILTWMEGQPDLASRLSANRRRIEAGAHRLNARYLLDGGQPAPALRAYGRALSRSPRFALQHWHRMLYAALSLAGGKGLAHLYNYLKMSPRSKGIPSDTIESEDHKS